MADNPDKPGNRRLSKRMEYVLKSKEAAEKQKNDSKEEENKPQFKPMKVVDNADIADIPKYNANENRRLSKQEMDEAKDKFDSQMEALIENPKQARRSFIADELIKKQEEKKSDLNTIAEQLVKAQEEEQKLPEKQIDDTFKDSNMWEKTTEYLSKTQVKTRWMFVITKEKDESHSIELIHTQAINVEQKTNRKIIIDGKDVLAEETNKTEYTQLFGGNVYLICIQYNNDDKTCTYDLKINNKTHQEIYQTWKKKNVFVE